jgi:hypothetical protein
MNRLAVWVIVLLLVGCAKVTVQSLDADGKPQGPEGLKLAESRPYLLVAELPLDPAPPTQSSNQNSSRNGNRAQSSNTSNTAGKQTQTTPTSDAPAASAASAAQDVSFYANTKQYVIKLIYLPDYSHSFVISESPGLFGSSEMKEQLQDGWMLNSLDAAGDSKTAETLTAIGSIVAAAMGGGGGGASKAAGTAAGAAGNRALTGTQVTQADNILQPGLYRFHYIDGVLVGLVKLTGFCSDTGIYPTISDLAKIANNAVISDRCAPQTAQPGNP